MGAQAQRGGLVCTPSPIFVEVRFLAPRKGFTLLELLVSMTLMGLLAVAMHLGFRIGTNAWAAADNRLEIIRARQFSLDLLSRQISAMVPYYSQQNLDNELVKVLLFQGAGRAMRFVTSFSAHSRSSGGLRLVEYFASNSKSKGGSALLVNEQLLPSDRELSRLVFRDISRGEDNTVIVNFFEYKARADSLCLFDDMDQIQFQYFRPHLANQDDLDNTKEHLPLGVAIHLRWSKPEVFSAQDLSVVVPTHATS
jgi:prepilin-type N-terminal cleavage/methylation domain-containing protein